MAAVLKKPVSTPPFVSPSHGPMGFLFTDQEMKQLLEYFYFGKSDTWESHLDKLDHRTKLEGSHVQAISYEDRNSLANPLLRKFTHADVQRAIDQLAEQSTMRCLENRSGWLEYCLRVWVGRVNPRSAKYRREPMVRTQDIAKALVELSKLLVQPGPLSKEAKVADLMRKLSQ